MKLNWIVSRGLLVNAFGTISFFNLFREHPTENKTSSSNPIKDILFEIVGGHFTCLFY